MIRNDWTVEEVEAIYWMPLLELLSRANEAYRRHFGRMDVQVCHLISVKTGGCSEDCKYCAQSSRYQTNVKAQPMMELDEVMERARWAASCGVTRICLGMAWRQVKDGELFERLLQMVKSITDLGLEVCCTLGMLTEAQAQRLAAAGLYAYNHNLDTSRNFYPSIITTRKYDDRLDTLETVKKAGLSVCCGGIIGMGESERDRIDLLHTLATLEAHPDSVPINILGPVEGTPLAKQPPVSVWEMARMIATARLLMPRAMIRLSAGRFDRPYIEQALWFLAGANSIHYGEKLLTIPNQSHNDDEEMFALLGIQKGNPHAAASRT